MISLSASASHCSGSLRIIGTVLKLRCRGALANRSDNCCKWCASLGTRPAAPPSLAEAWRRLPAFATHAANPSPIAPSAVRLCSIIVSLPFGIIVVVHVSHLAATEPTRIESVETHQIFGDLGRTIVVLSYQSEIFFEWAKATRHVVRQDKLLDASLSCQKSDFAGPCMQLAGDRICHFRHRVIHDEDIDTLDHGGEGRVVAILVTGEGNAAATDLHQIAERRDWAMLDADGGQFEPIVSEGGFWRLRGSVHFDDIGANHASAAIEIARQISKRAPFRVEQSAHEFLHAGKSVAAAGTDDRQRALPVTEKPAFEQCRQVGDVIGMQMGDGDRVARLETCLGFAER